jgi:hypothetical protein
VLPACPRLPFLTTGRESSSRPTFSVTWNPNRRPHPPRIR